jgi:hypothetical protein
MQPAAQPPALTLIMIVHAYIHGDKASLWMLPYAPVDANTIEMDDDSNLSEGTKLIGPVSRMHVITLVSSLKRALEGIGVRVSDDTWCDD